MREYDIKKKRDSIHRVQEIRGQEGGLFSE